MSLFLHISNKAYGAVFSTLMRMRATALFRCSTGGSGVRLIADGGLEYDWPCFAKILQSATVLQHCYWMKCFRDQMTGGATN